MVNPRSVIQALLLAGMLASAGEAGAEEVRLGLKGGLAIPNISGGNDNAFSAGYGSRLAANFGVLAEFGLTNLFSVQGELNFAGQGGKRDGLQAITVPTELQSQVPPGTTLYANYESEAILNYLELPVLAKFGWGQRWRLYVDGGVFGGLLLNARNETSGTSPIFMDKGGTTMVAPPQSFDASTTVTDDLKRFNFGLAGGGGLAFRTGRHEVMLDLRGAYGLTNIQKDAANGQNHTGSAVVSLGYSFLLGSALTP